MNTEYHFPTMIYIKDLPNPEKLNQYLEPKIIQWSQQNKGVAKTNAGGWHSTTDMNTKKEYNPLTSELFKMAEECNKDYGIQPKLGLGNMWANVSPTYSYNKTHTHPNSLWSGVYYVKVPKNSGKLFLEDPRPGPNTYMPRRLDKLPKQLWRVIAYEAVEGRMIFFPSWQPHGVDINMNTEKGEKNWRVSVSYNFIQT